MTDLDESFYDFILFEEMEVWDVLNRAFLVYAHGGNGPPPPLDLLESFPYKNLKIQ